jgi:LPXTG-motif cell wall-anchored protein
MVHVRQLSRPVVGVLTALAGWAPIGAPPSPVDVVPVLTSTPFAAAPGRPVSHTVTLSGTGTGVVPGVKVTFTTTVGIDGVTASASRGACPVVTALTVVCELGDVTFPGDGAAVTVTVTGTVHPGTAPGTLVQNLVTVSAPDADPGDNAVSNAYLVAGASTAATRPATAAARPPAKGTGGRTPLVAVAVGVAALAAGAVLLWWRRRRS